MQPQAEFAKDDDDFVDGPVEDDFVVDDDGQGYIDNGEDYDDYNYYSDEEKDKTKMKGGKTKYGTVKIDEAFLGRSNATAKSVDPFKEVS